MINRYYLSGAIIALLAINSISTSASEVLYKKNCASCHAESRIGAMGPALLPDSLARLDKKLAGDVILNGRVATRMPAFKEALNAQEIASIIEFIYQAPEVMPSLTDADIMASRKDLGDRSLDSNSPKFDADPWNLFLVVETGDHHVTLLDGDKFEPITRFKSHFALHGGPKFTQDGRFVYFASRDGWVSKYDIYNMQYVAEIRTGINTRNVAVSDNGEYVAVANYWPRTLVILDGKDLSLIKTIPVASLEGKSSRLSAVYHARQRKSFVVALKDVPELWEVPYGAAIKNALNQSSQQDSKNSTKDFFTPIHINTGVVLDDFFFSTDYTKVIGATRPLGSGTKGDIKNGLVIDLDLKRKIAELDLPGMPHLGSGIIWNHKGRQVLATPNFRSAEISVIDMQSWETIKRIKTEGPGFFMRSHENTNYAWSDVFFGPNKDKVHIIDKQTLDIVKTLQPEPGKTAAHLEFTKDGRYTLMSIMEDDGAIIVYDAETFEEVKRIPMKRPVGKYNIYNKTHLSAGTSH